MDKLVLCCYNARMQEDAHAEVPEELLEQRPTQLARVPYEELRELAADLNQFADEEYDEAVQFFLKEILKKQPDWASIAEAATMLLQDEIDLSPELAHVGIEPDEALVELFLGAGADVNARNPYGTPPLVLASQYGYEVIVQALLAAGADANRADVKGQLPLDVAATPAIIALLDPNAEPAAAVEELGGDDAEGTLPAYIEDGDIEAPEKTFFDEGGEPVAEVQETPAETPAEPDFTPKHDCGCGDCGCKGEDSH